MLRYEETHPSTGEVVSKENSMEILVEYVNLPQSRIIINYPK